MKKAWFLKILKTFGISLASILGAVVLTGGVMYLVGALNPKKVELTNMNFTQEAYVLDGVTISENGEVSLSNFDNTVKLTPENEDATELDVSLSVNANSIAKLVTLDDKNVATETNVGKVGTNLIFDLTNSIGGTFDLTANQDFLTSSTKIFVDLKLNSFGLASNINDNNIYPGTKFTLSLSNCSPSSYLRKPSANNTIFYSVYGENYFNKSPLYFSSNENIATVNQQTGEITVLDEGEFTIFVYVPRTFKLNANLPAREDFLDAESYFNTLANYCVLQQKTFTSKSIEIGSITSSTEVHNLNVFSTYKYSFNDLYSNTDNKLNLNIKIHVPTGTSFEDKDLDYKAKDIEIYEGVFDSEKSTYSILPFTIDETTGERISEHFKISKTYQKNPYWHITPIDYYSGSQNYCLIAVIDDNKDDEKIINGKSLLEISETNKFHFSAVKVVNTYTPSTLSLEKVEYLLNLQSLDVIPNEGIVLTNEDGTAFSLTDLNFNITPENASYKKIAFFIDASTPDGVLANANSTELKPETDGENLNKILIRAKNTGVAYINAVIVKSKFNELGETYYTDTENTQVVEMSQRIKIKLVITSKINFENFAVNTTDITKENEVITGFKITKGKSVNLSFDSNGELLTVYNQGLFKIYTSAEVNEDTEKIALDVKSLGTQSQISITGTETGETILYLELNGVVIKQFNIQVVSDAIKTLTLSENDLAIELDYEQSTPSKNIWKFNTEENLESFDVLVSADEGKEIKNLKYYSSVDSDVLEIKVSSDFKKLTLTPKKQYDGVITLSVSTENSDNQTIYSTNTIQISIVVPKIVFVHNNYNNSTTIAGKEFEQVVSGVEYDIIKKDDSVKYIYEAKIEGTDVSVEKLFTILSVENYYEGKIFSADEITQLEISLKTSFGLEKTINVLILPKYQLVTSTLSLTKDQLTSPIDLNNYDVADVIEYSYDSNNKIQKISTEDAVSLTFESTANTLGTISGGVYTKPDVVFENVYDKVSVKAQIDGKTLISNLNIQLYADATLSASPKANELFAGETVNVNNLLELSATSCTLKITKVDNLPTGISYDLSSNQLNISSDFKDLTANILISANVFNNENEKVYTFTDFNLELQISYHELFLNENYLIEVYSRCSSETIGSMLVVEDDAQLQENEIHQKDAGNFAVGEYVVKVKKLYLFSSEFELDNLVLSATKTSVSGVSNANDLVEFSDALNNQITSISSSSTIYAKIVIDSTTVVSEELLVEKVNSNIISTKKDTLYESISYAVSDLIKIENGLENYSNKILQSAKIIEVLNNLGEPLTDGFVISNNLIRINDYNENQIEVKMEILGQESTFDFAYDKLITLNTENTIELYSNTQKELFTKVKDITYVVQVLDNNNVLLTNEYITLIEDNGKQILKIGAINSEILFKVKIQVLANGIEGGEYYVNVKAMPLSITQNATELISGYEYDLSDVLSISSEMLDVVQLTKENDNFDFTLTSEGKIIFTCQESTQAVVNIEIENSEDGSKLLLKKLTFSLLKINIERTSMVSGVYEGQVVDSITLLSFINLKTDGGNYVNSFKTLVKIDEVDTDGNVTIPVNETEFTLSYSLGTETSQQIVLSVSKIIFTNGEGYKNGTYTIPTTFDVYSGTILSNYVQAGYLLDTNFISLNTKLRFNLVSDGINDKLIQSLSADFETTGTLTLKAKPELVGSFKIEVTLLGVENIKQEITFNVSVASSTEPLSETNLGVGDFEINISNSAYFGTEAQKLATTYEFEKFELIGASGANYIIAKTNGIFVLLKDGMVVANIEDNVLNLTSNLDSMKITIVGYLNASVPGITLVSTKEEQITFAIKLTKINVSMQSTEGFEVSKRTINSTEHNQISIETSNNIPLSNKTTPSINDMLVAINPNDSTYNKFTSLKIVDATVCNKDGQVLFQKDDGSGFDFSDDVISLTTFKKESSKLVNQTITLMGGDSWVLTFNNKLANFVHITLEYTINLVQTGTINIILAPSETLEYTGSTTNATAYTYNGDETTTLKSALLFIPSSTSSSETTKYKDYDLVSTNNSEKLTNFAIYYTYLDGAVKLSASQKYSCTFDKDKKEITITIDNELSHTHIENNKDDYKVNYFISIEFNNVEYYYRLALQDVKILTQIVEKVGDLETATTINSSNPLKIKDVLQEGINSLDLKKYIYAKTNTNDYICINSEDNMAKLLLNQLYFDEKDVSNYSISQNGILTIKNSINEKIEVTFTICGKSYSIFVQGEIISVNFVGETNLLASASYYIFSTEETLDETLTITTTQSKFEPAVVCKDYLSFNNFVYSFGGNKVTEQSLFDIDTSISNKTVVSYVGETLAIFTKVNNYYCVSNLVGGFGFDVVTQYKETINKTSLTVGSVIITTNYISPSVVEGVEYQNILSNTSTDLETLINCSGGDLEFSLENNSGVLISGVSINGSNLIINSSVVDEMLLTIKVNSGEIFEYYHVRVIPRNKVTLYNNNPVFNVIKNDTINLSNFVKVERFVEMDSENNPIYAQDITCYYLDETQISSIVSYKITQTEQFNIKVKIDETTNLILTFKLCEISENDFEDLSCFVGESLNVKEKVLEQIKDLHITLTPTLSFSNENNDISTDGTFQSLNANANTKVEVKINNITLNLTICVNDFTIEPKYPSNAYILESESITTKYINAYATQTLTLSDYISLTNFDKSKLNFELISSSFSAYSISGISNKIIYKSNGVKIFEINNSNQTITVYKELNDLSLDNNQLLIGLNCFVSTNSSKSCQIFLRLQKVEVALTKTSAVEPTNPSNPYIIKSASLIKVDDNYYFDLKNVATAQTICTDKNIYLSNKLKFNVIGGSGSIFNSSYLKFSGLEDNQTLTSQVRVLLGESGNQIDKLIYLTLNFDESLATTTSTISEEKLDNTNLSTFNFSGTEFIKTIQNTSIISTGKISAIYSEDYLVTLKTLEGETFNAYVLSQNNEDVMWISVSGTYKMLIENYHDVKLTIEAKKDDLIIENEINFVSSSGSNSFEQPSINLSLDYEYENGIKYYVLNSGNSYDVLTQYTIVENNSVITINSGKISAKVSETTFAKMKVKKGEDGQVLTLNFKIYPTIINKLYTEDFTLLSDIDVTNTSVKASAVQKNRSYKTLYVFDDLNEFDLNNFFTIVSNNKKFDAIFEISGETYLNINTENIENSKFTFDSTSFELNGTTLKVLKTNTVSFVKIKVTNSLDGNYEEGYFRFMPLSFENLTLNADLTSKEYQNNSEIELSELCKLVAKCENTLTNSALSNANDVNLTNYLTFNLTQATFSKIEGDKLIISEVANGDLDLTIKLQAKFNNILIGEITLKISNENGNYKIGNECYEEFFDLSTDTDQRTYTIENFEGSIQKIVVDGIEYSERVTEGNKITFTTKVGSVSFDLNGNVTSTDNNIIYVFLKNGNKVRHIKLNNYRIVKVDSTYNYYENGELKENMLRFELINSCGLMIENTQVTDETIQAGGITLNRLTGELEGTTTEEMFVKIYVHDGVFNTSDKFIILSIETY